LKVPCGSTPKAQPLPSVACATALMVPSPPAATTTAAGRARPLDRFARQRLQPAGAVDHEDAQAPAGRGAAFLDDPAGLGRVLAAGAGVEHDEKGRVGGGVRRHGRHWRLGHGHVQKHLGKAVEKGRAGAGGGAVARDGWGVVARDRHGRQQATSRAAVGELPSERKIARFRGASPRYRPMSGRRRPASC
jgi:hypothetical protein